MKFKIFTLMAVVSLVSSAVAFAKPATGFKKVAKRQQILRAPSSVSQSSPPMGQGESMLHSMMTAKPRFMSEPGAQGPLRLAAVCKAGYGRSYYSRDPGYQNCMDARPVAAGRSVDEIMGPAQRQAGFGFTLGN